MSSAWMCCSSVQPEPLPFWPALRHQRVAGVLSSATASFQSPVTIRCKRRVDIQRPAHECGQVSIAVPDVENVAIALTQHSRQLARGGADSPRSKQRREVGVAELRVAAEHLVAALPVDQHLHARFARRAHDAPLRIKAQGTERHVLMPGDPLKVRPEVVRRGKHEMWSRADRSGDLQRVVAFVECLLLVTRGERVEAVANRCRRVRVLAPDLANDTDQRRRIEPAAEAASDAHVADQVMPHRIDERVPQIATTCSASLWSHFDCGSRVQ